MRLTTSARRYTETYQTQRFGVGSQFRRGGTVIIGKSLSPRHVRWNECMGGGKKRATGGVRNAPPQKRGVRWELPRPTALGEAQEAGSASPRRDDGPGVFQLVGGKHPQRFAADYQTVNGGLESLGIGGCRVSIHDGKSLRPWVGCWS